ncbi:hypothetical protein AN936_02330 [Sphingopyxis macrogoltabida]|uniref:Uncharacterized protein n=1 Tax=Sphingopyxis macrogoltabida TaxID=33050 RepID=A0A0N9UWJ6_SPHMC|nr:hypothetical protein AN936_02330 [Sphingopyxis macrogoltabida]
MAIAGDIAEDMTRHVVMTATIVPRATACPTMAMTAAIVATIPTTAAMIAGMNGETATSGVIRSAGCTTTTAGVTGAASRGRAGRARNYRFAP